MTDDDTRHLYVPAPDDYHRNLDLDWVRGSVMFRRVNSPLDTPTTTDIRDRVATVLAI